MKALLTPGIDYPALACGTLIWNEKHEFLMLLRSEQARNDRGMWGLPGGLVDFGEKVEDAAKRESKEEVGVDIQKLHHIGYVNHFIGDSQSHFVSIIFTVDAYTNVPKIIEKHKFTDIGWFAPDQLPSNTSSVVVDVVHNLL